MRFEFRSLGIWSVVKVGFLLNLIFGFIYGLFFALVVMPMMSMMAQFNPAMGGEVDLSELGPVMIIIMPIMFSLGNAVFGTVLIAIAAMIYNLIARLLGGIEYNVNIIEARDILDMIRANTAAPASSYGAPPTGYSQPPQEPPQYQPAPPPRPTPPPPPPPPPPMPEQPSTPPPPPTDNRPPDNYPERPEGI